jgi:hypothetical protein
MLRKVIFFLACLMTASHGLDPSDVSKEGSPLLVATGEPSAFRPAGSCM